ncbi:hypothetical protein B0J14DRAFT_352125 [Halenospora varia]|nr:hypothetical protein B0J14DRAFT_352125 [Halenospora varia]
MALATKSVVDSFGAEIINQSMHDCHSRNCPKLIWDGDSYESFQTPVVSIKHTTNTHLKYVEFSNENLAISHCWAHGQGGRPETGMNTCLHERYTDVTRTLGCDTYWMDTPCIPSETRLRKAAIRNINHIFWGSKATLICDRDLMEIDISPLTDDITTPSAVKISEAILVALLVCDWNVRGWTFLEACRGKEALYLLCKNNKVCALADLLKIVSKSGNLELLNLFISASHLIPPPPEVLAFHRRTQFDNLLMFLHSVEAAGTVLSRHPASRPDDNLVIWSLLFSDSERVGNFHETPLDRNHSQASRRLKDAAHKSATELWKNQVTVSTTFLVSSAPRIQGVKGLSWAPRSRVPEIMGAKEGPRRYYPYIDIGDEVTKGWIRHSGLVAEWFTYLFLGQVNSISHSSELAPESQPLIEQNAAHPPEENRDDWYNPIDPIDILGSRYNQTKQDQRMKGIFQLNTLSKLKLRLESIDVSCCSAPALTTELHEISTAHLSGFRWGILLRPAVTPGFGNKELKSRPVIYESNPLSPVVAVCGSNEGKEWVWRGGALLG